MAIANAECDPEIARLERRVAELELRCNEYRMLDETGDAIPFRMTTDLVQFLYVGPQAQRLLGIARDAWLEPGFFEARLAPEDYSATIEQYRLVVEFGASHEAEFRLRRDDGTWVWVRCAMRLFESSTGCTLAGHLVDITVRRTLASDLAQVQRLEAVGRLAAGIAHEINTPIQFVGDNLCFIKEATADLLELVRLLPGSDAQRVAELEEQFDLEYLRAHMVEAIESSGVGLATVATLVRTMKVFAHPDGQRKEPADLNQALLSASVISAGEYKLVADVKTSFDKLPPVSCYAGELNQVFLNIIINAAHAIQDVVGTSGKRGTITIATSVDGAFVVVAISDTGAGIPEHVRGRIFDPFFTTKDVGKGSGQGLAISNKIVEKHGGSLTFETELGRGTTFFVRVPIAG